VPVGEEVMSACGIVGVCPVAVSAAVAGAAEIALVNDSTGTCPVEVRGAAAGTAT
jgi:hypothetical protein